MGTGPPGGWTRETRTEQPRILTGTDADSVEQRDRRSNESLLITVLWRRLSMFSRRGSSRSTKRQAVQNPKPASRIQECGIRRGSRESRRRGDSSPAPYPPQPSENNNVYLPKRLCLCFGHVERGHHQGRGLFKAHP